MIELLFIVNREPQGGYSARAVGASIFTQAETDGELERNVREAVQTHFDSPEQLPQVLHLHYVHDVTIPLGAPAGALGPTDRYPLRGRGPYRYDDPTAPVAPDDWDAK